MLPGMTNPDPIPPIATATDPIANPADLHQRWRALMGPLGFGERLLRFTFVGPDRRLIKILHDVEIPRMPDPRVVDNVFSALRVILDDLDAGVTVAFLLTRPGSGGVSEPDRSWAKIVVETAARFDVPIEPFFRANDEALVPLDPPSDRAA